MKLSTFLFLSSFILFTFSLDAQLSIGLKAGYSNAWEEYGDIDLPADAEIDVRGFYISALAYYKLSKHISIGIEPGYVQRGAACVPGWLEFTMDTQFKLNYLELPVFVRADKSFLNDKFVLFAKVGFGGSYLQRGTEVIETTIIGLIPETVVERNKIDFKGEYASLNQFDYGLYGAFGLAYNIGNNQLFVEGTYYNALIDFDNENTSKNRSIQIGLGVMRSFGNNTN